MEHYSPQMEQHATAMLRSLSDAELCLHYLCLVARPESTTGLVLVLAELTTRGLALPQTKEVA